jgi:hypothetical protein
MHLAAGPWQISPEAAGPNMMHPLGDQKQTQASRPDSWPGCLERDIRPLTSSTRQ